MPRMNTRIFRLVATFAIVASVSDRPRLPRRVLRPRACVETKHGGKGRRKGPPRRTIAKRTEIDVLKVEVNVLKIEFDAAKDAYLKALQEQCAKKPKNEDREATTESVFARWRTQFEMLGDDKKQQYFQNLADQIKDYPRLEKNQITTLQKDMKTFMKKEEGEADALKRLVKATLDAEDDFRLDEERSQINQTKDTFRATSKALHEKEFELADLEKQYQSLK